MSDQWYCQMMGALAGPLSFEDLSRAVQEGHVSPNTLVRQGTNGIWISASRIEGLFGGTAVTQVFTPPHHDTRPFQETMALGPPALPPIHHHPPTAHDVRVAHHKPHGTAVSLPGWLLALLVAVAGLSVVVFLKVVTAPSSKQSPQSNDTQQPQSSDQFAELAQQADSLVASTAQAMESIVPQLTAELRALETSGSANPDDTAVKQRGAVVEHQKKVYAAVTELRLLSREIKDLLEEHPGNKVLKQMLRRLDDERQRCENLANSLPEVR